MARHAKGHEIFGFVAATYAHSLDMMNIQFSVVYGNKYPVLILKSMECPTFLAGKIVAVQYSQRIWIAPTIPYRYTGVLLTTFVGAEAFTSAA